MPIWTTKSFGSPVISIVKALSAVIMSRRMQDVYLDKIDNNQSRRKTKRSVLKKIIILGTILAITLSISTLLVPAEYLIYFQATEIAIVGYVVMEIMANTAFKLAIAA
jgi:hypothetical protein